MFMEIPPHAVHKGRWRKGGKICEPQLLEGENSPEWVVSKRISKNWRYIKFHLKELCLILHRILL